jgi:hypothetical protein
VVDEGVVVPGSVLGCGVADCGGTGNAPADCPAYTVAAPPINPDTTPTNKGCDKNFAHRDEDVGCGG